MNGAGGDRELAALVRGAVERLRRRLASEAPALAQQVDAWMGDLAGGRDAVDYFLHPAAFPTLQLPWWLEPTLAGSRDPRLQADVAYSSVSGYCFVRLVDDLMDGEAVPPATLLPALTAFHSQFGAPYRPWFAHDHEFWELLDRISFRSAEAASADAALTDVSRDAFERISAAKICGAIVPLAAVAHHHERSDVLPSWTTLVEVLGRWHQMRNDVRDWRRDLAAGRPTYVLSEARRMAGPDGSIPGWLVERGLDWAFAEVERRLADAVALAGTLGSEALDAWLAARRDELATERAAVSTSLAEVRRAAASIG